MRRNCRLLLILVAVAYCFTSVAAFIDTLYCGKENCYDVLEVNRDSSKEEIGKAYRSLARKNHPDRFKSREDKVDAEARFRLVATAYETLRDDEARADYNYMLDNPDEYYQIYYRYYRRRVAPKVDIRVIVLVSITVISGIQYYVLWSRYNDAIKYLARDPKYRSRAIQSAVDEGTWTFDKKKQRGKTREEIKEEEDAAVRVILESKMDIKGGYGKPTYKDILWVQIVLLPYSIYKFIGFYVRWIYRYKYHKLDYEEDDKLYLIRKNLKYSQTQWEAMPEKERDETVEKELWKDDNFKEWKKEKDEKTKAELAQNGKYKAYRRWMKKGGAGQITFGPDE